MRHVHLIDTSVASDNLGDEIIVEAARAALGPRIAQDYVTTSSGHDGLGHFGRRLAAQADVIFLLGTNALSAKYRLRRDYIWSLQRRDISALEGRVVLLGVGANRDYDRVSCRQARLLARLLSPAHRHSVRDDLALGILRAAGREGLNTSCPTLWRPMPLPGRRARPARACLSLTAHKPDAGADAALLDILRRHYDELWFWAQQPGDVDYLRSLPGGEGVGIVPRNLAAYDALLGAGAIDVIGTRLHGCIRAMQRGQRALIISIDNRAREIARETGLSAMPRADVVRSLEGWIATGETAQPRIPRPAIDRFLDQFGPERGAAAA